MDKVSSFFLLTFYTQRDKTIHDFLMKQGKNVTPEMENMTS